MGLLRCGIEGNAREETWQFRRSLVTQAYHTLPNHTIPYHNTLHHYILSDPGSTSSWPVLIPQSRKVSNSIMATTIPYLNTPYHTWLCHRMCISRQWLCQVRLTNPTPLNYCNEDMLWNCPPWYVSLFHSVRWLAPIQMETAIRIQHPEV